MEVLEKLTCSIFGVEEGSCQSSWAKGGGVASVLGEQAAVL